MVCVLVRVMWVVGEGGDMAGGVLCVVLLKGLWGFEVLHML